MANSETDMTSGFTWLNDLNPQQREAATAGDGPVLVVAGRGQEETSGEPMTARDIRKSIRSMWE